MLLEGSVKWHRDLVVTAVAIAGAAFVAACAGTQQSARTCEHSPAAAEAALERIVAADNRRDLAGVLSNYTDDVVWLPPGGAAVQGKAAIRPRYEELFSLYSIDLSSHIVEAAVEQDLGFVRGNTRGTLVPLDGSAAVTVDDKFLALVRCDRGAWRVSHLMWSPRGVP